ncbi:MAG TPA: diaminopimelate decarboxylase, partial [Planctomycetota bacterium]|nr:diaminopimelate decarboxylase [Planctomycetota bacterium]
MLERLFEGSSLAAIATQVGTPAYVYDASVLRARYATLRDAFARELAPLEPIVAFSVKACPSLGVLALLARDGAAFDVVSGGELIRVVRAGGDPRRIVFAGVGKTDEELALAVEVGVLQINVESAGELGRLERLGGRPRVALRVNPGVDPDTHKHLATG